MGLCLFGFASGSLPIGFWAAKFKGLDIRQHGSGNTGATNVWRMLGWKVGLPVFIADILKAAIPVILARILLPKGMGSIEPQPTWFIPGFCAIIGHIFSPFLGYKGGKGVASALGAVWAVAPICAMSGFVAMLITTFFTRYISLGSLVGTWVAFTASLLVPSEKSAQFIPVYFVIAVFITYKHRENIKRLLAGTESKFSLKIKASEKLSPNPERNSSEQC
jgi:glycerol-3-phosphate acyltransferase PlsY